MNRRLGDFNTEDHLVRTQVRAMKPCARETVANLTFAIQRQRTGRTGFYALWEAELLSSEIKYLAKEITKQNTEGTAWFL